MKAHAARGERGLAVQAYDRCRAVLADMLDAAPSVETQKLSERNPRAVAQPPAAAAAAAGGSRSARQRLSPRSEPPPRNRRRTRCCRRRASARLRSSRGGAHIGVMPFRLVGMPDEDAHLAPGLADEITNALSRFRWMFIVSSNSLGRFAAEQPG